jgi:hypothetical protein
MRHNSLYDALHTVYNKCCTVYWGVQNPAIYCIIVEKSNVLYKKHYMMSKRTILSFFAPASSSKRQRLDSNEDCAEGRGKESSDSAELSIIDAWGKYSGEAEIESGADGRRKELSDSAELSIIDARGKYSDVAEIESGGETIVELGISNCVEETSQSEWYVTANIGTWREVLGQECEKDYFKRLMVMSLSDVIS